MKVILQRVDDAYHFEAKNEDGKSIHIDASEKIGGRNQGVNPMQMMLMSLAGCSAIDIISVLKKQKQQIDDFEIEVEGEREKIKNLAAVFTEIKLHFKLKGNIDVEKAQRAADLSMEKYCSVAKTLRLAGAKILYSVSIIS